VVCLILKNFINEFDLETLEYVRAYADAYGWSQQIIDIVESRKALLEKNRVPEDTLSDSES
jgi:hypothetical protein